MYQIAVLNHFKKELKPYLKKYDSLREIIVQVLRSFDARQNTALGQGLYKIRLATPGLGKGKSKSFRLIILVLKIEQLLVPVTIYYKGDRANMTRRELNQHLRVVNMELDLRQYL